MASLEIERKFLLYPIKVECLLKSKGLKYEKLNMEQFYIKRGDKVGRVRKVNDRYFLTLKKGEGLVREESESEIDRNVFQNLLSAEKPIGALKKFRYKVKMGKYIYEIDEFLGELDGLVMLEVEFDSSEKAHLFELDPLFDKICLREVTSEKEFLNEEIAIRLLNKKISCEEIYSKLGIL